MDYRNASDLTGSVAVITGGARGIGFEPAVALGSCGAKIVLAVRDPSALDAAVKRLAETGASAAYAVLDVTDPTAVTKIAGAAGARPDHSIRRHRCIAASYSCRHSITSSAVICIISGTVRPSAFAVLRLMNSSTFVACWTGRSAGLSPLRIRPV
jgi:NAD(P)-dependent dehydrogenase (short-subunit alcohol dehydrogenase family)